MVQVLAWSAVWVVDRLRAVGVVVLGVFAGASLPCSLFLDGVRVLLRRLLGGFRRQEEPALERWATMGKERLCFGLDCWIRVGCGCLLFG